VGPWSVERHHETRIEWARGLSNDTIAEILNAALMTARAERGASITVVNELAHEIKFRLLHGKK
jgi:hypothetical protein